MKSKLLIAIFSLSSLFSLSAVGKSPYINKVYEYQPAPGQFINTMPEYESGDTKASILQKVQDAISGEAKELITLGGYGGYVIFGFDHTILNVAGINDFRIWGNAFTGSSEPGIIMVSKDENGDGYPDDKWYVIGGSEYNNPSTIKDYEITYAKPANDNGDVAWVDNDKISGKIERNQYHDQPYYPQWIEDATLKFQGIKLPDNAIIKNGAYYFNSYEWGYADNWSNTNEKSEINIEWALDEDGDPANLSGIDFIKVYTGLNQSCGELGETSTEVSGAEDLHVNAGVEDIAEKDRNIYLMNALCESFLTIRNNDKLVNGTIISMSGVLMNTLKIDEGESIIDISKYATGVYFIKVGSRVLKFIKI